MSHLAYYRVSTADQSTASQRETLLKGTGRATFDEEFFDEGVSGATPAAQRPGFSDLLKYARKGDTVHVTALDRLGRDAYDIQTTARTLTERGVAVRVLNFPAIEGVMAEFFFLVMAGMAQIEKQRINERTAAGRETAKELLRTTGKTQHGKDSMGRPKAMDAATEKAMRDWKAANNASHAETAKHFGLSVSTVRRYAAKG